MKRYLSRILIREELILTKILQVDNEARKYKYRVKKLKNLLTIKKIDKEIPNHKDETLESMLEDDDFRRR